MNKQLDSERYAKNNLDSNNLTEEQARLIVQSLTENEES